MLWLFKIKYWRALTLFFCILCPQIVQGWARGYQQRRPLLTKDVNA